MKLMIETLNDSTEHLTEDKRVRISINTFLTHFFAKYAEEFKFGNTALFGNTNADIKRKINFLNMTSDAVEALTERELKDTLISHGIDVSSYKNKKDLVNKALRL